MPPDFVQPGGGTSTTLCACGNDAIPGWDICTDCEGEAWIERRGPLEVDPSVDWSRWRFITETDE